MEFRRSGKKTVSLDAPRFLNFSEVSGIPHTFTIAISLFNIVNSTQIFWAPPCPCSCNLAKSQTARLISFFIPVLYNLTPMNS